MTETTPAESPSAATAFQTPLKTHPGGTKADIPFKQATPKHGGIAEIATHKWAAWTGGEPSNDWSGLKTPNPTSIGPNQYRSSDISSQAKAQYYRTQGLETKFTRDGDLQVFQKKVLEHLETYGLDTITYLSHPKDKTTVVSVIEHHALFQLKDGVMEAAAIANAHFDTYDQANQKDAKKFLLNAVDEHLEKQLYENCNSDDTFVAYWLNLMRIVRSMSIDRFDKIKDKIKSRHIKEYQGKNIELMASAYLHDWQELHGAGLYDQNLTIC